MRSLSGTSSRCSLVVGWMVAIGLTVSPTVTSKALAQAMEYVVFSIDGAIEGLSLGQVLHEGYSFEVPKDTSVNLVSKQGEVITLIGPAMATVTTEEEDKAGEKALASISDLLFSDNKFVPTIGGTRSTGSETSVQKLFIGQDADQAWFPVISSASHYCVAKGSAIIRRDRSDTDLALQTKDGDKLHWKAGANKFDLNDHVASLPDNSSLQLSVDGRTIQIFSAAVQSSTISQQAAWMARKGCKDQALKLLASEVKN